MSGYLGRVIPREHRAALHVEATVWIWKCLIEELKRRGVSTEVEFLNWLSTTSVTRKGPNQYKISREKRLALPKTPGVYQMFASDGTLLYVGKATSLHARVNSYFRQRRGRRPRLGEMLSQVSEVQVTPTETSLEAGRYSNRIR